MWLWYQIYLSFIKKNIQKAKLQALTAMVSSISRPDIRESMIRWYSVAQPDFYLCGDFDYVKFLLKLIFFFDIIERCWLELGGINTVTLNDEIVAGTA